MITLIKHVDDFVSRNSKLVWLYTILTYGVGDLLTTYVGIEYLSLQEANPLPKMLYSEYDIFGLIVMKVIFISIFYSLYRSRVSKYPFVFVLPIVILGSIAVFINVMLIIFILL